MLRYTRQIPIGKHNRYNLPSFPIRFRGACLYATDRVDGFNLGQLRAELPDNCCRPIILQRLLYDTLLSSEFSID